MSRGFSVFLVICLAILRLNPGACGNDPTSGTSGTPPASASSSSPPPTTTPPPVTPAPATAPTASFSAATSAAANTAVAFDASASSSTDASALQYYWDFGSGHHGGGVKIARMFASAGAQSVTLTVVDGSGHSASVTKAITISAPPAAVATASVQGVITGLDGAAIAGVVVSQVGGTVTGTTDGMGHVALTLGLGVPITLRLTASGRCDQFVTLQMPATTASDAYFTATMRTRDAPQTLADAAAGGTLTGRDGAMVTLPANALVNGAGVPVTGAVQISMTPVDVTQPAAAGFPGSFDGITSDGTATPIVSYGTVEYLLSANGAPLQLAVGKTAIIEIPVYAQLSADGVAVAAGQITALWSLDEITGVWVQEGTGTIVASATSPTGLALQATVTHLSWWNSDQGFDPSDPKPKCEDATNIGIPGSVDHLANATICNMLAQFDSNAPAPAALAPPGLVHAKATTLSAKVTGYARSETIPIAGGEIVYVPANVNIALTATALNGTWAGRIVYNGAINAAPDVVIPMNPIAGTGTGPEAVTLPVDVTRALQTGQTALFSFTTANIPFVQVTIAESIGSSLVGQVRLLKGTTELGKALFSGSAGSFTVPIPGDGAYTFEVTGIEGTPGSYRLQAMATGSIQSASLQLPFDVSGTLPELTDYRGTFTTAAPGTAVFGYQRSDSGADAAFSLVGPTGTTVLAFDPNGAIAQAAAVSLPVAGTYTAQLGTPDGSARHYRITGESTQWALVAPPIATASVFAVVDLVADRTGKPVVGFTQTVNVTGQPLAYLLMLRRWNGSAWETVGTDLSIPQGCTGNGTAVTAFAFDSNNAPVVAYASKTAAGGSNVTALRYSGGTWQPLGSNGGVLPNPSSTGGACTLALPALAFASDGAPVLAYVSDNIIYVQRFDGTAWGPTTTTSTDQFPIQGGSMDLRADGSGQIWLVTADPGAGPTTVWRLNTATSPPKWAPVGPNSGVLPQVTTAGLNAPQLRFDAANAPVLVFRATVTTAGGAYGVAAYRYDGTQWSSSGGHEADATTHLQYTSNVGVALYGGETYLSWTYSTNTFSAPIAQKYTGAGYAPVDAGLGTIPQYTPHGLVAQQGFEPRVLATGAALYMALVSVAPAGSPAPLTSIQLLQKLN